MNYKISFQERAWLGMEILFKQSPVTIEMQRLRHNEYESSKQIKSEEAASIRLYLSQ